MSKYNLVRLGGLATGFGGLLSVITNTLNFILLLSTGRPLAAVARGPLYVLLELLGVVIALFFAAGLTGLYTLLRRRSRLGISGLVLAYLSVLASLSFILFAIVYIVYQVLTDTDDRIRNPWVVFPENAVDLAGALFLGVGVVLLGMATFEARALGRWSVLPLFLGALILIVPLVGRLAYYLGPADVPWSLFFRLLTILRGLCWVLLGGVLWAYASRGEARRAP